MKKIVLTVLALLITSLAFPIIKSGKTRKEEAAFHASIPKTIPLTSSSFTKEGMIAVEYTADGEGYSPALAWSAVPEGTKSLVLVMTDYDAPAPWLKLSTVTHWVLYNIPADIRAIDKNETAENIQRMGISTGQNYKGERTYAGPNPPVGKHTYRFTIYALDVTEIKWDTADRTDLFRQLQQHALAYGELTGRY